MIPKLNDKPLYDVTIPSTGETTRFRPYLVKEEKILLMAFESDDRKTILKAIVDTIQACLDKNIDPSELTLYDVEYLFTKIRGKSVGEVVPLEVKCKECGESNPVDVNIDNLQTETGVREKRIPITDGISVLMKQPSYVDMLNDPDIVSTDTSQPERIVRSVAMSISKIYTEDFVTDAKEEDENELVEFVESLDQNQFKQLFEFIQNAPKVRFEVNFDCKKCGTKNEFKVEDERTFFT